MMILKLKKLFDTLITSKISGFHTTTSPFYIVPMLKVGWLKRNYVKIKFLIKLLAGQVFLIAKRQKIFWLTCERRWLLNKGELRLMKLPYDESSIRRLEELARRP